MGMRDTLKTTLATVGVLALSLAGCGERSAETGPQTGAPPAEEAPAQPLTASQQLEAMAARHAADVLQASPELATVLGVGEDVAGEGYSGRLGGYGFAANERARALNEEFLQEIRSLDRNTPTVWRASPTTFCATPIRRRRGATSFRSAARRRSLPRPPIW